jgi:hypothetical protein
MTVVGSLRRLADAPLPSDAVTAINMDLEQTGPPLLLTEKIVERCWSRAVQLECDGASRWLLLIRLAEAALLCAGNYADNCEFRAAGDFLVNPREIVIRSRCGGPATIKKRHGRLSEQLGLTGADQLKSTQRSSAGVVLEITKPPLLPLMTRILKESGRVAPSYVHRLEGGQRRIADALAFMAGWRIADSVDFWRRMRASSSSERAFAESCMCRFDTQVFRRIGDDLQQSLTQPDFRSSFLSGPHGCGSRPPCRSSAAQLELLDAPA